VLLQSGCFIQFIFLNLKSVKVLTFSDAQQPGLNKKRLKLKEEEKEKRRW